MDVNGENIKEDYLMASKGREYWLQLKEKYTFKSEDALVLCAVESREWLKEVEKWLPEFIKRKHFPQTILLCTIGMSVAFQKQDIPLKYMVIEKEFMECLLKYYRLTTFTRYIYAISLEPPFGNDFMIGHKGITIQDWLRNFGKKER